MRAHRAIRSTSGACNDGITGSVGLARVRGISIDGARRLRRGQRKQRRRWQLQWLGSPVPLIVGSNGDEKAFGYVFGPALDANAYIASMPGCYRIAQMKFLSTLPIRGF